MKKSRIKRIRKNKTKKYKGGAVLGKGKDGCIIDSISCNEMSKENGFVSKFLYNSSINPELHLKLKELDPENERYNRYYIPDISNCIEDVNYKDDLLSCSEYGKKSISNMIFQRKLDLFDEKRMSKIQYRYLIKSLEILHANNMSHGDLPSNIMLNPANNMPVIIDWENAKLNADSIDKQIDMDAFMNHCKIAK